MTNVTTDCSTNHNAIGKRIQLEKSAGLPLGITNAQACHKYRFSSSTRNAPRHCTGNPLITQFQKPTARVMNCEFSLTKFCVRRIFSNIRKSGFKLYRNWAQLYSSFFLHFLSLSTYDEFMNPGWIEKNENLNNEGFSHYMKLM